VNTRIVPHNRKLLVAAATAVFQRVAHALTPQNIPAYSVLPRGTSGNQ